MIPLRNIRMEVIHPVSSLMLSHQMNFKLHELENIKPNKSSGYDGISAKIIKIIAEDISKPLTHIFNLSFSSGTIPVSLKVMKKTGLKITDQYQF